MKELKKTIATLTSIDAYLDVIGYNTDEIKENINLSKEELNKAFSLGVVMQSNHKQWLLYSETKFVADGVYMIKTNFDRIIEAERFNGSWIEHKEPIIKDETVLGYFA